jgi:hypothetical protein
VIALTELVSASHLSVTSRNLQKQRHEPIFVARPKPKRSPHDPGLVPTYGMRV